MSDERPKYLHGLPRHVTTEQCFRVVCNILRESFAPERPVRIRRVPRDDSALVKLHANGYTHLANSNKPKSSQYFIIAINRDMDWGKQLDALMHEWAHAMTWDIPSSQDHNREWAHAYGKLYRRLIED